MYVIHLDEETGLSKIVRKTQQGKQLHASFSTIQDFCNAFTSNAKVSTPILPPSCFKYSSTSDGIQLFLFYPSREINFSIDSYNRESAVFKLKIPNTVIKACLSTPIGGITRMIESFMYFTDSILPSAEMKLYKPTFPNIYDNCRICFGSVNFGNYNSNNLFGIDSLHSMFFNNNANTDLWGGRSMRGDNYNDPIVFLRELSGLSQEDQTAVYFESHNFKTISSAILL